MCTGFSPWILQSRSGGNEIGSSSWPLQRLSRKRVKDIQLSKAKLLGKQVAAENPESAQGNSVRMDIGSSTVNQTANIRQRRTFLQRQPSEGTSRSTGPHLIIDFMKAQLAARQALKEE